MNVTYGICTSGEDIPVLETMLQSIISLHQNTEDEYEIILVGPLEISHPKIKVFQFNEKLRNYVWITKKKNIIIEHATMDYICFAHDYFFFDENWLEGWKTFSQPFDVAMNRILTLEGKRHSDWCINPLDYQKVVTEVNIPPSHGAFDVKIPYDEGGHTPLMYIAANYWMSKTAFMKENPMDESLAWKDAEDVEWSCRVRNKTIFRINTNSLVSIMKPNKWAPNYIPMEHLERLWEARRNGEI